MIEIILLLCFCLFKVKCILNCGSVTISVYINIVAVQSYFFKINKIDFKVFQTNSESKWILAGKTLLYQDDQTKFIPNSCGCIALTELFTSF